MAHEVLVTSREFDGLRNRYTGEKMTVMMAVIPGMPPMFHAVNTFSTYDLQKSTNRLYEMWSRVDGRQGIRSGQPKCAYTGRPLTVAEYDGKFRFIGGFDPNVLRTREEFLYYATMKDGKSEYPDPSVIELVRVTKPGQEAKASSSQKAHAESVTPTASQDSVEIAAGHIQRHRDELNLPTKVSMSVPGKGGKRR